MDISIKTSYGNLLCKECDKKHWFLLKDICVLTNQRNPSDVKKRKYVVSKMIKTYINDKNKDIYCTYVDVDSMLKILQAAHKIESKVKEDIIKSIKEYDIPINIENIILFEYEEITMLKDLKEALLIFNLSVIHGYTVGKFHVDYYIPETNMCIEYDEKDHCSYDKSNEIIRENYIRQKLKCGDILRVSNKDTNAKNIAIILKHILKM